MGTQLFPLILAKSYWNQKKVGNFTPPGTPEICPKSPTSALLSRYSCPAFRTVGDTVDGRNTAPPGMYETLRIMGKTTYQLVQDFFYQQYVLVFMEGN